MKISEKEGPAIGSDGHQKALDDKVHSSLPQQYNQASCEQEFREAMGQAGIDHPPSEIIGDSRFHYFTSAYKTKPNTNCRYIFHGTHGYFCDWSKGIEGRWSTLNNPNAKLTRSQRAEIQKSIETTEHRLEEEELARHKKRAQDAQTKWESLAETGTSKYLERKKVKPFGVRFGKDYVAIPLKDTEGKLHSLQKIYPDGTKRFLYGGRIEGCFHTMGVIDEGKPLYVVEGYATGASVHMATQGTVIVAFNAGNLPKVVKELKTRYPTCPIVIAGDDDCWKEKNIGREKAEEAANTYGCRVVFPKFIDTDTKPTDWNDLHCLEGISVVRTQLQEALKERQKPSLPSGFFMRKDGLYVKRENDNEERVCSPIQILACTRDENQENWGRLVRFEDLDGHIHVLALPMELLKGDYSDLFGLLLSSGLRLASQKSIRNKFVDFLQNTKVENKALCTSRIGWHGKHFVLPNGSIPETDEIYLQSDNSNFVGFRSAGTLEEWKEHVAKHCQSNSRLVFALSSAFAAPLLPLLHNESGGFNLKGASSIGKSTALAVAASVWGSPKFIQQWKTTGNALETIAEAHNNALLCLDELGQVDGKEAGEIAYMLANGSGKNRMKAKGGLRKKFEWNSLFLSTGEISIADKIREAGKQVHAGMITRMVDIPADANKGHRLFDTIHEFKDGNALAHHLKNSVSKYYGVPIRTYLSELAQIKGDLPEVVERIKQDFFSKYVPRNADGQVQRVARRFVVVAAAGELTIKLGILPYETGEAFAAAGICFEAWLEERGNAKGYEGEEGIKQVQAFFEAHHSSRFAIMTNDDKNLDENSKILNQAGFKRKIEITNSDGTKIESWEFFVFTKVFRDEICKGFDFRILLKELADRGFLLRSNERQFVKEQRLPIGKKRVYHFTSTILTGGDE